MLRFLPNSFLNAGTCLLFLFAIALPCLGDSLWLSDTIIASDSAWIALEEVREYQGAALFEHINGDADQYFDFGFLTCLVRTYGRAGNEDPQVEISIYDQGRDLHAFGLFRDISAFEIQRNVGMENTMTTRQLRFWKQKYFCSVVDRSGENLPDKELVSIAKMVAELVSGKPAYPGQLGVLPTKHRIPGSERFALSNFLSRSFLNQVIYASYGLPSEPCTLFVALIDSTIKTQKPLSALKEARGNHLWTVQEAGVLTAATGPCAISTKKTLVQESLKRQKK